MHNSDEVPNGTKPKKIFSRSNIIVYGTLLIISIYYLLPLWVMVMTSLKGMPEIRMGNIFSPPLEVTFEPWVKAWSYACTGINCDGLSRGFWNSVISKHMPNNSSFNYGFVNQDTAKTQISGLNNIDGGI